jgi:hypothetical protein
MIRTKSNLHLIAYRVVVAFFVVSFITSLTTPVLAEEPAQQGEPPTPPAPVVSEKAPGFRTKQFMNDNKSEFFDPSTCSLDGTGAATGGGSSGDPLPDSVPEPWRTLINQAAEKHPDSDRRIVAATLWAENRGWPEYKDSNETTSNAAAVGFWQFIPSTWASLGEDGDGDGVADPKNPKDAVHAAFKHSPGSAGKPILNGATGNADDDFNTKPFHRDNENLMSFMANYNGSGAPDGVTLNNFPLGDQNSDYVRMGYWLISSNFTKGWMPEANEFVDASKQGPGAQGGSAADITASSTSGASCNGNASSSGKVNAEGYAFPIALPKDDVSPSGKTFPCERDDYCGHHDGSPAFDISDKEWSTASSVGTPVIAIHSGKIERLSNRNGKDYCWDFQLVGDDGWWYWYGHSQKVTAQNGQTVKAGDKIAEVGPTECADNTASHLHIDRGSPKGNYGGALGSRDPSLIPLMNSLWEEL